MKMLFLVEIEGELELDPESICATLAKRIPPSVNSVMVKRLENGQENGRGQWVTFTLRPIASTAEELEKPLDNGREIVIHYF